MRADRAMDPTRSKVMILKSNSDSSSLRVLLPTSRWSRSAQSVHMVGEVWSIFSKRTTRSRLCPLECCVVPSVQRQLPVPVPRQLLLPVGTWVMNPNGAVRLGRRLLGAVARC